MNKTVVKPEESVIDLTDDLANEASTSDPEIEFIAQTRARVRPIVSRRSKFSNTEIIVVEDVPEVLDNVPTAPLACHFFYPSEEDGGGDGVERGAYDPLAPIPEWVDCSTLHSEQVPTDDEVPTLENLPEKDVTPYSYVDPLCIARSIKTEPGTEVDIKPSLAELSTMITPPGTTVESCSLNNSGSVEKSKPKNAIKTNCSESNKRKNSLQIDVSCTPTKRLNTGIKIGPKCAKFRQKEKETSISNSKPNHSQDTIVSSALPLEVKKTNTAVGKSGPKCAKFRQKEKETSISNSKPNYSQDTIVSSSLPLDVIKTNNARKVGPKCAKFRQKLAKEQLSEIPSDSKDFSKSVVSFKKEFSDYEDMDKNAAIKPAVVSIGPKLPLPQCFQQKVLLQDTEDEFNDGIKDEPDNHLDKDHIVLKIYTCVRCNHKCTDPLFHEAHVTICSSKRRSRSLNLSLQGYNKHNGYYRCEICIFKFKNQENLTTHLNYHGVKGFLCHICHLTFLTLNQLNQHSNSDHKNLEKVFTCNVCEYSSLNLYNLKDHMVLHNKDRHLLCSSCKQNYEDKEDFQKHHKEMHKNTKVTNLQNSETKLINEHEVDSVIDVTNGNEEIMTSAKNEQPEVTKTFNEVKEKAVSTDTTLFADSKHPLSALQRFEAQIIERKGLYHCNGCVYKFAHLKNLTKHKKYHLKINPFSCCNGSFVSFSLVDFSEHVQAKHSKTFRITCSTCPLTFKNIQSFGRHVTVHVNDGLFCHRCRLNLEDTDDFTSHISTKHRGLIISKYSCSECSFRTSFASIFNRHLTRHRTCKIEVGPWMDVKCNEVESSNLEGTSEINETENEVVTPDRCHGQIKSKLNAATFSCTICSLKFSSAVTLKKHTKYEHEKDQSSVKEVCDPSFENEVFKCNKCTFKCSQSSEFLKHMKNGHSKQKFVCNICRNEFAHSKAYLKHMKNHAACAVVYTCNECRFTNRKELMFVKHLRTHTLKRCPLCDFKTLRSDRFKIHLETIHTIENEQPSTSTMNCPDNVFVQTGEPETTDSNLKNKIVKHYTCCFCSFETTFIHNLRRHMAIHFKNNPDSSEDDKLNNKISKPSLTKKRLKANTFLAKKALGGISKGNKLTGKVGNKLTGKVVNNLTLLYGCTQCEYKKKCRKSVVSHLYRIHNIRGSVRNSMIKKVYDSVPLTNKRESKTGFKNKNGRRITESSEMDRRLPQDEDLSKSLFNNDADNSFNVFHGDLKNAEIRRRSTTSLLWKCSSCDLQKLSLLAQLQHKKFGHIAFWRKPFSCKICGYRSADKANLAKHLKWKHERTYKQHQQTEKIKSPRSEEDIYKRTGQVVNNGTVNEKQHVIVKKGRPRTSAVVNCQNCNVQSFSRTAQLQHNKLGHDAFWVRPFSCNICDMRFSNKATFSQHNSVHQTTLTCTNCKTFITFKLKYLLEHKRTCNGFAKEEAKRGTVPLLNNSSTQSSENRIRELNNFDDDESFVCGECDFVTKNVIKFSTHMFIHSGIPDD